MRVISSLLIGLVVPTIAVLASAGPGLGPAWAQAVLLPGRWFVEFAGPMPVVGHGASGNPIEEPTMRHLMFGIGGIVITIAVYAVLGYLTLLVASWFTRGRTRSEEAAS